MSNGQKESEDGFFAGVDDQQSYIRSGVYNKTQILEKYAEPETEIMLREINRNFTLGNLKRDEVKYLQEMIRYAKLLLMIPDRQGGELCTHDVGLRLLHRVNSYLAMSCSIDSVGRMSAFTKISEVRDKTYKPKFGIEETERR